MISAQDILDEAKQLLALPRSRRTEARCRTIIARSYYAAYHHMIAHEVGRGYRRSKDETVGMHRAFIDFLKRAPDPEIAEAGWILHRLHRNRITADYKLHGTIPDGTEQQCWEDAENLIVELFPT